MSRLRPVVPPLKRMRKPLAALGLSEKAVADNHVVAFVPPFAEAVPAVGSTVVLAVVVALVAVVSVLALATVAVAVVPSAAVVGVGHRSSLEQRLVVVEPVLLRLEVDHQAVVVDHS